MSGPRRVVVAPTAFKGTWGPVAVADALATGVRRVWPAARVDQSPLSDGGTGLLEVWERAFGGTVNRYRVAGPLGHPAAARMLWADGVAVIESAEACGLPLIPEDLRDPMLTTTRGVGELLARARDRGARRVVLGLGGSGTVDGGTGMARALGWSFLDPEGRALPDGGGGLVRLGRIEQPADPWDLPVTALCDVSNPLLGEGGAARVYGPQKGASPEAVRRLEAGLARLAAELQRTLGLDVAGAAGAGAAGGLGAGARAFLDAELVAGADWLIERLRLAELLDEADLLVTGEGEYDAQSAMGKATGRLLTLAEARELPVLVICGRVRGRLPDRVRSVEGEGRRLGLDDLAALAESGCRALAGEGRL